MNFNPNHSHQNLWFLQTTLSSGIRNFTTCLLDDKRSFEEILDILESKFPQLKDIKQKYSCFIEKISHKNLNILSRFDIEKICKKRLSMHAPIALEYRGNPTLLSKPLIGIVGSRHPTYYGRLQAQKFSRELSHLGFGILSGGAIGVDSIANGYSLESSNGGSLSVIGSGVENPYPASNNKLFKKLSMSQNGLLLSEFESTLKAQKWCFPKRNSTIAELCDFLLVIEATKTSGSLMTAKFAFECGKSVGALPGNVDNPNTGGSHLLIQNGAYCIHEPKDLIKFFHAAHTSK